MMFNKFLLALLLTTLTTSYLLADDTCVDCKNKKIQGLPAVPSSNDLSAISSQLNSSEELRKFTPEEEKDFKEDAYIMCLGFGQASQYGLPSYIMNRLEKNPTYKDKDYYLRPGCCIEGYGGDVRAPLMHVIIDLPDTRKSFVETMYKYFTLKKKDPDSWIKAINAKNTEGETFLDYIEFRIKSGKISNDVSLSAAKYIKSFICTHGGVYSKYPDSKCQ